MGRNIEKTEQFSFLEIISDAINKSDQEWLFDSLKNGHGVWFKYGISEDDFRLYITADIRGHSELRKNNPGVDFDYGGGVVLHKRDNRYLLRFYEKTGGTMADTSIDRLGKIKKVVTNYIERELNIRVDSSF